MIIYENILRAFQKKKVKYVLVGGIALNLLGYLRSTLDMDILVEMSDDNLAKVVTILKKNGYIVKQPVEPMGLADKKTREDWIKNKHLKAFNFYKEDELKEVDIIIKSPLSYEKAKKNSLVIKSGDIALPVISLDDLILMKKNTGRLIDKVDVENLKKIKKIREMR